MEIIGIICEYNPFHNGHIYHLKKIKEMYPDAFLVLVLNGYFLERGEISLLTKEDKVKIALYYGIDLIIELPVLYGTQSADIFAQKAVELLNYFHVQKLIFGSELNAIEELKKIALKIEDSHYQKSVKEYLKQGINYPTALAKAIDTTLNFNNPNDLLAISYVKAIRQNHFLIDPISIKRTSAYHDLESTDSIISASNIRHKLKKEEDITPYLPKNVIPYLKEYKEEIYFKLLKAKVLTTPNLENFLTVDEGIENRLVEGMKKSNSYKEFLQYVKTKRYTYNKLNRMCIHILLGIKKQENVHELSYIKILGFNEKGQNYIKSLKKELASLTKIKKDSIQYQTEMKASLIYDLIMNTNTYSFEIQNKPIKKL